MRTRSRRKAGLNAEPLGSIAVKAVIIAVGWGVATYILNDNRAFAGAVRQLEGVPWAVALLLFTVVGLRLQLTAVPSSSTRFLTVSLSRRWLMNLTTNITVISSNRLPLKCSFRTSQRNSA